jgi:hypothetical protein
LSHETYTNKRSEESERQRTYHQCRLPVVDEGEDFLYSRSEEWCVSCALNKFWKRYSIQSTERERERDVQLLLERQTQSAKVTACGGQVQGRTCNHLVENDAKTPEVHRSVVSAAVKYL